MEPKRLFNGELRLLSIIWANEPVASGELVRICEKELNWKKSTTYTVLRRLCEKELLQIKCVSSVDCPPSLKV